MGFPLCTVCSLHTRHFKHRPDTTNACWVLAAWVSAMSLMSRLPMGSRVGVTAGPPGAKEEPAPPRAWES